jgi:hypothetical protein
MRPERVDRNRLKRLTDLPNVGKAVEADLQQLGFCSPEQLIGECPFRLFQRLCEITGENHDLCMLDLFLSVADFLDGSPPRAWWEFTPLRKKLFAERPADKSLTSTLDSLVIAYSKFRSLKEPPDGIT